MGSKLIDTNIIVRFLVETPQTVPAKFQGVFTFFPKVEKGTLTIDLPELVLFETYFVLTRFYKVPQKEAAEKLSEIVEFKGVKMTDKALMLSCFDILRKKKLDLVDAYLLAYSKRKNIPDIYSYDKDLSKNGLTLIDAH